MATNSVQQPANLHDRPTKVRLDKSDMMIRGITYVVITIFSVCCILPFWMIIASSFSTEEAIRRVHEELPEVILGGSHPPHGLHPVAHRLLHLCL